MAWGRPRDRPGARLRLDLAVIAWRDIGLRFGLFVLTMGVLVALLHVVG